MSLDCYTDIKLLAGLREKDVPSGWVSGSDMNHLATIENAFLCISNGRIHSYGSMEKAPKRADRMISLKGKTVLPAWCDSHTHIVWAGSRQSEFVDRLKGKSYEEIARNGGGILNSAALLRNTSEEELYEAAAQRLEEVIQLGTGAIEIKSGYGLSYDSEFKMLRVIRRLKDNYTIPIRATFLGAHAIPAAYKENRAEYISLLTDKMLPEIAAEGLADYCDVFCDTGFFRPDETAMILERANQLGLPPKIHANELDFSGGIQVGVAHNAISVDHLECTGEEEIDILLQSKTMPTLLPGTAFFLDIPYPPARKMIDAGLPVALASDYNPGSTPNGRMHLVVALACIKMKMLPAEALQAATINGAYALQLDHDLGTITEGKMANFIVTKDIPDLNYIPYKYGSDLIHQVYIHGTLQ